MTINGWSLQIFIICGYFTSFLSFCHATTICAANPLSNCVTIAYNVSTGIAQCKLFNGITVIVDGCGPNCAGGLLNTCVTVNYIIISSQLIPKSNIFKTRRLPWTINFEGGVFIYYISREIRSAPQNHAVFPRLIIAKIETPREGRDFIFCYNSRGPGLFLKNLQTLTNTYKHAAPYPKSCVANYAPQ